MDHSIADLFRLPDTLELFNIPFAQIRMFDQSALFCPAVSCRELDCYTEVAIAFGHALITEMIALQLSKCRQPAALQNTRHLVDRDLSVSPTFYSASFRDTPLLGDGSHVVSFRQIKYSFLKASHFKLARRPLPLPCR